MARKSSVSAAVLDLAERLACRMRETPGWRTSSRTRQLETGILAETEAHAAARQAQQAEVIARQTAEQQISGKRMIESGS